MPATTDCGPRCAFCDTKAVDLHLKYCARCMTVKYCSKNCQKKHWKIHKLVCLTPFANPLGSTNPTLSNTKSSHQQNKLYEIKSIPGKGNGFVAVCRIPRGTRIIAESPIFKMSGSAASLQEIEDEVLNCLETVSIDDRKAFYALHNAHEKESGTVVGITQTNGLPLGSGAYPKGGIFLESSRINHSCVGNAQNSWNRNLDQITIHACRDIEQGEEITISYLGETATFASRQQALKTAFRFTCTCRTCSLPLKERGESDERLAEIGRLEKMILMGFAIVTNPHLTLHCAHKILKCFMEEGICDMRVEGVYHDAFLIAIVNGDEARAKVFAERAYTQRVILEGEDSPEVEILRRAIADPASHPIYGRSLQWAQSVNKIPRDLYEEDFENWLWKK